MRDEGRIRYIDAPVLRFHDGDTDGTIDDTLYYTTDANMNVTALVREVDGHWGVAERYVYDPYGHVTVLNGGKEEVEPDTWVYFDDDGDVTEWAEDADNTSDWDNEVLFAGYRFGGGERLAGVLGCGGG